MGKQSAVLDPIEFQEEERSRPSLQDALSNLWIESQLDLSPSPFTTEALILALIRRLWYAEQYLCDPLSIWPKPKDSCSNFNPQVRRTTLYMGADPDFAKWRNATCDCLDILHWDALSVSAKAGGFESTAFLSLHLARLVLLTPVKALLDFSYEFAGKPPGWLLLHKQYDINPRGEKSNTFVQQWWFQDRYKGRLALIHAGATLWHVRRYASESYMQPFAIYLATIVLWAYSVCARQYLSQTAIAGTPERPGADLESMDITQYGESLDQGPTDYNLSRQSTAAVRNSLQPDSRMPQQLQLDRPMDDEMVQYFIRHGSLRLYLEGVPDLCEVQGPLQILTEGATILEQSAGTWTIAERYAQNLHHAISANRPATQGY